MAERQYIGARYVPKFFENTITGDSTWASGVIYEALTIVTWLGNSYTSKKPVPASVGQPNLNTDYWVATGAYNTQIEELRQSVEDISESVDELESKFPITSESVEDASITVNKINKGITIMISDSYGYHPSLSTSWVAILAKHLGILSTESLSTGTNIVNDNLITSILGNRGFGTDNLTYPATFTDQLTECLALVENPDDVTRIIVCGGTNDMANYDTTKIRNGINSFCTLANSLKNAKTYCGMVGNLIDPTYATDNYQNVDYLYSNGDYIFMDGMQVICKLRSNMESDGQHPNTTGAEMLGKALYNYIECGNIGYWDFSAEETVPFTDGTSTVNITFIIRFGKDTTEFIIKNYVASFPKPNGNYYGELTKVAFTGTIAQGISMGIAPANNSGGDPLIASFIMNQPTTPYKGRLTFALFGNGSNTGNFLGQGRMIVDSHFCH